MSGRSLAVEHDGKIYNGKIGVIASTRFGWEDHGILTAMVEFKLESSGGIGVGGYCLDKNAAGEREGTAYGLDHVMQIMQTVGVSQWEDLRGQKAVVLFESAPGASTLGSRSVGIASLLDVDRVLIFADHSEAWRARSEGAAL